LPGLRFQLRKQGLDRLLRPARTKQFCYESARDIWALGCIAAAMARGLAGGEVLHPSSSSSSALSNSSTRPLPVPPGNPLLQERRSCGTCRPPSAA
jgi:serine/threonine protein kinase